MDKIIQILTARAEQAESVAVETQAESLPPGVKPPIPEAFKNQMDSETILNLITIVNFTLS